MNHHVPCRRWLAVWANTLVLGMAGCSSNLPDVEYVEGTVQYEGSPLAGAIVSFTPVKRDAGLPAYGKTGPDGTFRLTAALTTARGGRSGGGTASGEYVVTVTKMGQSGSPETLNEDPDAPRRPTRRPPEPVYLVPRVFSEVSTSPLRVTIEPGKTNSFEFTLEE